MTDRVHFDLRLSGSADRSKRWHWRILLDGKVVTDGYAPTEEKAALAANHAADAVMDALGIMWN